MEDSGFGRRACLFFCLIGCTVAGLLALSAMSPMGTKSAAWFGSVRPMREDGGVLNERADRPEIADAHGVLLDFLTESPFARSAVTDLLIREWVGEDPPEVTRADKLDDAIEAIQIMEKDGDPVGVEGYPYLFVGSVGAAMNRESLHRHGITHVVSWSPTARCDVFPEIDYLCIHNVLNFNHMLRHLDELDRAVDYVEEARRTGGKVMSHCWNGRNRSVTLLVAYLMKYGGMSARDAVVLLQRTRPIADPYRDALYKYGKHYLHLGKGSAELKDLKEWWYEIFSSSFDR